MKNRFLFRGKQSASGKWIVGHYMDGESMHSSWGFICPEMRHITKCEMDDVIGPFYFIDPDTVSQCTGIMADKSYRGEDEADRLIFEGDILGIPYFDEDTEHTILEFALVIYYDCAFYINYSSGKRLLADELRRVKGILITGNKWDHPELLEG